MKGRPIVPGPDALLEHAGFLRGLARRLLLDDAQADDAVQQTLLAALRDPPQRGNLRAWLTGVLRRVALMTRRAEGRRARRQVVAARDRGDVLPSTADVAARLETQRRVVAAVAAMDEPYRSVVVFRFFDELPPREIARRLAVPVETVKTRLKRALGQLRTCLDEEVEGGRAVWSAALLPAALPAYPTAAATATGTGAAFTLKGLITMKALATTGALAATAAVLFLFLRDSDAGRAAESPQRAERLGATESEEARDGDVSGAPKTAGGSASPSVRPHLLRGILRDEKNAPVAGARVRIGARAVVSDTAGVFSFHHEQPAASVVIEHPGFVRRTVRISEAQQQSFGLARGASVVLTVRDPSGALLPDVRARAVSTSYVLRYNPGGGFGPDHEFKEFAAGVTGGDGRVDLGVLPRYSVRVLLDHPGYARSTLELDLVSGAGVVRDVRLAHGGTVLGRVTASDGSPVVGARVFIRDDESRAVRTGARGEYVLKFVEPGDRHVLAASADHGPAVFGSATGWGRALPVRVTAGGVVEGVDIALAPATFVVGRVLDTAGRPREGLQVLVGVSAGVAGRLAETTTDADGRFRAGPLAPGAGARLAVEILEDHVMVLTRSRDQAGPGTIDLGDLSMSEPASVAGRVLFPDDRPAAGATVKLELDEAFGHAEVTADADGRFRAAMSGARVRVKAELPGSPRRVSRPLTIDLKPGEDRADLELKLLPVRGVTGTVRNQDGTPRPLERVDAVERETDAHYIAWTDDDGRFRFPALPGDSYTVQVHDAPATKRLVNVTADAGNVELVVPREGIAVIGRVLSGATDQPVSMAYVSVIRYVLFVPRHFTGRRMRTRNGNFEIGIREPGTYALEIESDGFAPRRTKRFTVRKKGRIDLGEIRLGDAGRIAGRVLDVAGRPVPYARVFLLSTDFQEPFDKPFTGPDGSFEIESVAPGSYNIFIVSPSHPLLLRQGVEVAEGKKTTLDFRLADPSPLTIRVLDRNGRPLPGAKLVYWLPQLPMVNSKMAAGYEPPGFGSNESDESGLIRKPSMPAGPVHLTVSAKGYRTETRKVKLAANEAKTIEVRLARR